MPPAPEIAVLAPHRHPRLRYALAEAGRSVGWRFRLVTEEDKWLSLDVSGKASLQEISGDFIYTKWFLHPFLAGGDAGAKDLEVSEEGEMSYFFAVGGGYDLLACIFYVLSRYEEYGTTEVDEHGRFTAAGSHAWRNDYLHLPVVRMWALELATRLRGDFPDLPAPQPPAFTFRPTYDIDLLWAWQHRGLRGIAAGLRDALTGEFGRAVSRFTTSPAEDPYLTLPFLESLHQRERLKPLYFWLLADGKDPRDTNPYPIPPGQTSWISRLAEQHPSGIHPSYHTMDRPALIREEAKRLSTITGRETAHSRQHWLRFRLPETYRDLRQAGITHEYSMGYADAVGWRAGTNQPFHWYDLEQEAATGLLVHPFAAMDVTLKNYLALDTDQAKQLILTLANAMRPYGGDFALLWHNSSFAEAYGWAGWREMYEELARELAGKD
jgi:hypothetical protein